MKIALIQPRVSYYVGGGEKIPLDHAKHLASLGNKVLILTTSMSPERQSFLFKDLKNKKIPNLSILEIPIPKRFEYIYKIKPGVDRERWNTESLLFGNLAHKYLLEFRPDIIVSYYLLDGIFNPTNFTNVLYLLGYPSDKQAIRKSFLRFYGATISISSVVKNKWQDYIEKHTKSFVLNIGVDVKTDIKGLGLRGEHNIVFAGRLIERKGAATLVEAFQDVIKKLQKAHLWILGDGPQKDDLQAQVRRLKLNGKVTFKGLTKNLLGYFKSADVAVFPSYEKEGLMNVVLEAMSVGAPVVTTTGNGNEDIIQNGQSGILVKPRQPKDLSRAITYLLKNSAERKRLGKNAAKMIAGNFTWSKKIEEFQVLLEKIAKDT